MAAEKNVSDIISVSDFLREWLDVLTEDDFAQDKADMKLSAFVAKEMNIDMNTIEELDSVCKYVFDYFTKQLIPLLIAKVSVMDIGLNTLLQDCFVNLLL